MPGRERITLHPERNSLSAALSKKLWGIYGSTHTSYSCASNHRSWMPPCTKLFSNWVFLESLPLVCLDTRCTLQLSLCDRCYFFFSLQSIFRHWACYFVPLRFNKTKARMTPLFWSYNVPLSVICCACCTLSVPFTSRADPLHFQPVVGFS